MPASLPSAFFGHPGLGDKGKHGVKYDKITHNDHVVNYMNAICLQPLDGTLAVS